MSISAALTLFAIPAGWFQFWPIFILIVFISIAVGWDETQICRQRADDLRIPEGERHHVSFFNNTIRYLLSSLIWGVAAYGFGRIIFGLFN
ncbi:hypothetical protein ACFCW2_09970 [Qipengyuania sp. DSG2-2]|uniref:hypothetical protein n=1 Tax=Qipengyuania sp. DGS2-2 TaxID=3349631 RepID=UPI0036D366D5